MANIEIRFLDTYPVYSFGEKFKLPEAALMRYEYGPGTVKTDRIWKHVYNNFKTNLFSQVVKYEVYVIESIAGKNLDFYRLQASNHVYIEPVFGDPFWAVNITIEASNENNNRDSYFKMTFMKQTDFEYPLSSDYAESLNSSGPVNHIDYDVDNPPYVFNNITIARDTSSPFKAIFQVPFNDLTDTIEVDDVYYLHTAENPDFQDETDTGDDYLSFAQCTAKDANYVYFVCSKAAVTNPFSYDIINLEINHVAGLNPLPSGITVADKTISFEIYTFIDPIIGKASEFTEAGDREDGIKEDQKFNNKDIAIFKVWLKISELYKAEYLNYALNKDVLINLVNYTNIVPVGMKNIITIHNNDNLFDISEYNIRIPYNNKMTNLYR